MEKLCRGERIEGFETTRRHKNGSDILVSLTISPIRDAHGEIIGASKVSRDISQNRRAELAVQHMMEGAHCLLWQATVEDTGAERLQCDLQLSSEQAAQRFLPLDVSEGQEYIDAWRLSRPREDAERADRYSRQEIRAGRNYQQAFRCHSQDGTLRWLWENVQVEVIGENRWRCIGVCTDITEQKRAEEERDRFFTLSLDLLCVVDFNGRFTRMNPAFETVLGYTSAELMAKPFLDLVLPLALERLILLDIDDASFGHDYIQADRQRLKQVLINLLSNAIKYNRAGGQVRIYNVRVIVLSADATSSQISQLREAGARVFHQAPGYHRVSRHSRYDACAVSDREPIHRAIGMIAVSLPPEQCARAGDVFLLISHIE